MATVTETNLQVSAPDPCDAPNIQVHLRLSPISSGFQRHWRKHRAKDGIHGYVNIEWS